MARRRNKKDEKQPKVRRPRLPRSERPAEAKDDGGLWLIRISTRAEAARILNDDKQRPYWLSIPHGPEDGVEPVAGYLPCTFFRTKSRIYYGFLIRDHREAVIAKWENARRELTEAVERVRR